MQRAAGCGTGGREPPPVPAEEEGGCGNRRLIRARVLIRRERGEGLQRVPLADGAQRLARGQPLVDALQVEAVLAGQHAQLLAVPARMHILCHIKLDDT